MALINWSNTFSVGIPTVDEQHQKLIGLINNLADADIEGERALVEKILADIIDYTVYHFDYEEKIFDKIGYEHVEIHRNEHKNLKTQALDFQAKFKKYKIGDAGAYENFMSDFLKLMKNWLMNHILEEDKKYTKVMQAAGIK